LYNSLVRILHGSKLCFEENVKMYLRIFRNVIIFILISGCVKIETLNIPDSPSEVKEVNQELPKTEKRPSRQKRWVFPDISFDLTLPQIVNNLEKVGLNSVLSDRTNYHEKRNKSSVEEVLQSLLKNFQHFHLPGLPSIRELSDASRNVTMTVQREIEEKFDHFPSLKQISEMSKKYD